MQGSRMGRLITPTITHLDTSMTHMGKIYNSAMDI